MITASDAVLAAAGFLGFRTPVVDPAPRADRAVEAERPASADLLSQGEPYFEAVAAALRRTGYLNA